MPMTAYPVLCYTPGCGQAAEYKVAARWSDGVTRELKTYGLACEACLPAWFRRAKERHSNCRLASGETLLEPAVYRLRQRARDQELERLDQREKEFEEH
jgi:hypothetical protein